MRVFEHRVAVITGAASGLGLAFAHEAGARGMKLVLADVEASKLAEVERSFRGRGIDVLSLRTDVSQDGEVKRLADAAFERFGRVHLLFNNAGVAPGGLIWEHSATDWAWVMGVNVIGVANGLRAFIPRMLEQRDEGYIVNTASVAGLLSAPLMGAYNASKHAVVAMTETLYQDLKLVDATIGVSVLCPAFVPTAIAASERNRPKTLATEEPETESMRLARASSARAVQSGKLSADDVAKIVFSAIEEERFYIVTHPKIMASVQTRLEDVGQLRNPTDPFALRPDLRPDLKPRGSDEPSTGSSGSTVSSPN